MGGGDQKNVSINVKKKKNGSFTSIFMHADVLDCFFMVFGLIGAIGDGLMTPLLLLFLSRLMNSIGSISGPSKNNFVHSINEVLSLLHPLPPLSTNKISIVRLI